MVTTFRYVLAGLFGVLLLLLLLAGLQYWHATTNNQAMLAPAEIVVDAATPVNVLFARAHYLAASGDTQTALDLYNRIENQTATRRPQDAVAQQLWQASKYNMGLIYLQQALSARADKTDKSGKVQHAQFVPLVELATSELRAVISANPAHYDARLSMEQALSLLPETVHTGAGWKEQRASVYSHVSGVSKGGP